MKNSVTLTSATMKPMNPMNPMSAPSSACHRTLGTTPIVARDRLAFTADLGFAATAPTDVRLAIVPVAGIHAWSPSRC